MAPKFNLKQIRRRSLASFRTSRSTDTSSNDEPSSSSQELSSVGSITPPSLADESESDPALHTHIPTLTRPPLESNNNRFSIVESVASEHRSTKDLQDQLQHNQSLSQYAPQVTNIQDKATVYQKVLLVTGVVGQDANPQIDGTLLVSRPDKAFPSTIWPVYGGQFKALVYLLPGPNTVCFEFQKPGSPTRHRASIVLYMFDPKNAPPLQLAVLVAKDSPYAFDQVPTNNSGEDHSLEKAVSKFRTAAYLWQSFTAEQMEKNDLGRRTFRFDEEWTNGTSHPRDFFESTMRSEARVHIVRMDMTVAEIHDLASAQQINGTSEKNQLVSMAAAALRDYFRMAPGQKQYVASLILDSHWDMKEKVIKGHTAFGGQVGDDLHLAIFGSHFLNYYPSTISEAVKAFRDCSPTELKIHVDEGNVAGTSWEAAAYGIGAHLREVGHLLGSPRQEKGIMAGDFITVSRAFLVREAYSTRTKSKGGPVESKDEPAWHRLDVLGYRFHPLFRNTTDKIPYPDGTVHGWVVAKDKLLVTASSGLLCAEIFTEGDEFCSTWVEYPRDGQMIRRTTLIEPELRERLPESKRRSKMTVIVRSMGGGALVIDDLRQLCANSTLKLTSGPLAKLAYRSMKIGPSELKDSEPQEVIFSTAIASVNRIMTSVTIYHDNAVYGLEFHYEDGSSQLFGKRGGNAAGDRFIMDIRNAEVLVGFAVRAGSWIDAIQIITSTSRRSNIYGKMDGGSLHTLLVPNGFKLCGVSGSCADWLNSFSLLITK
ncbi:metallopeptidase [Xylaria bambusicola]|uniref:metallopeptidase n=1 Tax=Xylaria bambusicola TaxID=326684 RepID=UPI00200754D1|nr:metallopeptidase [Xylaria bambusicola]KAI0517734.1 metallopeptidase [Xylaria bambusicola]